MFRKICPVHLRHLPPPFPKGWGISGRKYEKGTGKRENCQVIREKTKGDENKIKNDKYKIK
jgi:hypothetical protein